MPVVRVKEKGGGARTRPVLTRDVIQDQDSMTVANSKFSRRSLINL